MLRTSGRPAQPPVRMALPHLPGKASVGAIRIETCARDETRNCGEINRELLLRPEAEVVLGRAVRRCRPTARFVRFLQPEAADRTGGHTAEPRRGRRRAALRSWLPTSCYARPGSWTAGRPVDLAAAIAQQEPSGRTRPSGCSMASAEAASAVPIARAPAAARTRHRQRGLADRAVFVQVKCVLQMC